jgi:hypothetical protein
MMYASERLREMWRKVGTTWRPAGTDLGRSSTSKVSEYLYFVQYSVFVRQNTALFPKSETILPKYLHLQSKQAATHPTVDDCTGLQRITRSPHVAEGGQPQQHLLDCKSCTPFDENILSLTSSAISICSTWSTLCDDASRLPGRPHPENDNYPAHSCWP